MKYGIYTLDSQILQSEYHNENPSCFLKRNAIFFEKLIFVPSKLRFSKEHYLNGASKEVIDDVNELENILLFMDDFIASNDINLNGASFFNFDESMWGDEELSGGVRRFCSRILFEKNWKRKYLRFK